MRIGIYNHQHLRGGCPICTQTYVQGMIADGMKCMNRAKGIYGPLLPYGYCSNGYPYRTFLK